MAGEGATKFSRDDASAVSIEIGAPATPSEADDGSYVPTKQDSFKVVQESVPSYRNKTFGEFDTDAFVYCGLMDGLSGDVKRVEDQVVADGRSSEEAGIILRAVAPAWCPAWIDKIVAYYSSQ